MTTRWLLATLHLLALPFGFAAVWIRAGALGDRRGALDFPRIFAADTAWGLAGLLWISTGLLRAFGGWEKGSTFYLANHAFWGKMALLVVLLLLEMWPAVTLVRWRVAIRRGTEVDASVAPRLAAVSRVQAFLVIAMVLAATAMARGLGAQVRAAAAPAGTPARVEAISFLGDTLRTLPLGAATRERYERQLAEARAAYERAPRDADSIVWYGRRLGYLGRFRDALDVYGRGIALYPDDPWLYRHRGHRYLSVREVDHAITDLERATRLVAGKPDVVEPDGQPNAQNRPIGTLHSNIAYHLGLAYYLKGDFARAAEVYRRELADARNDDRRVSTAHWLYMSLRRLGRDDEAAAVLAPIGPRMEVIENDTYHRLLLLYKGVLPVDSVLQVGPAGEMSVTDATAAYGVGNWHLYNGRRADAERVFRRILAGGQWGAFGYVAAEAELARMR